MRRLGQRQAVYGIVVLAVFLAAGPAAGVTLTDRTWDGNASDYCWSTLGNWHGGNHPSNDYEAAVFNDPYGLNVPYLDEYHDEGIAQVRFNMAGWTINSSGLNLRLVNTYNSYDALYSQGSGTNTVYPPIEFLNASQNVYTGSGNTLAVGGGFTGSYGPIISSLNPTSANTGVVRLDVGSGGLSGAFTLRQGTILINTTQANPLGTGGGTIQVGDSWTNANAYANLLTAVGGVTIGKPITVNNIAGLTATLGGQQGSGTTTFSNTITVGRDTTLTASNADDGTTVDFTGQITGAAGIVKSGSGTVRLRTANNYAGGTSVQAGKLQMTAAGALPSTTAVTMGTGSGAVLDLNGYSQTVASLGGGGGGGGGVTLGTGTLTVGSGTYAGAISGPGGLTKNGSGTLTLSGASSYAGPTNVTGGVLALGASNAIGAGDVTVNGGTFALGGYSDAVGTVTLESGTISGTGGALWSSSTYQLQSGGVTAILSGDVGLAKTTGGTVSLGAANAFTGDTRIAAGTLRLTHAQALQGSTVDMNAADGGTLDLNGLSATLGGLKGSRAVTIPSGGMLSVGANGAGTTYSGALGGGGGGGGLTKVGAGTLILAGACGFTGTTAVSEGTLQIGDGGTVGSIGTDVHVDAALAFNRSDDIAFAHAIAGNGSVSKYGAGKLTLGGSNTYAGITNVGAGTLLVNGTNSGTGFVSVAANAVLGGTGSVGGGVRLMTNSTLAPGTSIGTLTVGGDVRMMTAIGTATLRIELGDADGGEDFAGLADRVNVGTVLDITKLAVDFDVKGTPRAGAYVFAGYGTLEGAKFAAVIDLPSGYTIDYNYQGAKQIALVPEPGSAAMVLLLGAFIRRRPGARSRLRCGL